MTGNWQSTFGGNNVSASNLGYAFLQLDANTALNWPLESQDGVPVVAPAMQVLPTAASLSLAMPDATQGATGIVTTIENPGNVSFTLTDTDGAQIVVVGIGQCWDVWLTDNGTPAGAWFSVQRGATTSNAQAAALAGYGLTAVGSELYTTIATQYLNTNTLVTENSLANGLVWEGTAPGTLTLDLLSNLTIGWWCLVTCLGTAPVTVATSGSNTINGVAQITLPVGGGTSPYSMLIVASSTGFNTFAGTPPIIPIAGGGTGADTAGEALINLGGSTIGIDIFEAPNAAAILALLGIGPSAFTEETVSVSQIITESQINTAFVCTAALSMTLPLSTTVTNQFLFAVYAQGGPVTMIPISPDAINGGASGVSFVMPQGSSAIWTTDASGHWWPLFFYIGGGPQWIVAQGTSDAIVANFVPPNLSLYDGLLIGVRAIAANTTITPQINVDGFGLKTIVKNALANVIPNDIPGAGYEMLLRYNLANTVWELLNPATPWLDDFSATQGAILYRGAQISSSNPGYWAALPPGTQGQVLYSGYLPAAGPPYVNPYWSSLPQAHGQLFINTGNFTIPAGTTAATVFKFKVVGGGGGGGISGGGSGSGGGGGGSGGYAEVLVSGFTAGTVVTATVGTGGAGSTNTGSNGVTGNLSKLTLSGTDFIVSNGGVGGSSSVSSPNAGGAAGTVTINTGSAGLSLNGTLASAVAGAGGQGGYAASSVAFGGQGGSNPYGQGGSTNVDIGTATPGQAGSGYGGGGGGGADNGNGGDGSNGAVIVEWFL